MTPGVVYIVGFSAPPVRDLDQLLVLLAERGWDIRVILSPTAATWADTDRLATASGHPVRVEPRAPGDPDPLPPADLVLAAPITFNSLNKWAAGISDTLALGLLNEALGHGLPIVAAPCVKEALRRHPAYPRSVDVLRTAGVTVLDPDAVLILSAEGPPTIDWRLVLPER